MVGDEGRNVEDMGHSEVVEDMFIGCMELITKVQTTLENFTWISFCNKGSWIKT